MTRWMKLALWLALAMLCSACASYATLGKVTVAGSADAQAITRLKISRGNTPLGATPGMRINKGDVIETDADTRLVLNFFAGEAVLFPGTRVEIRDTDPDLFAWFGKLWLHGLFGTKTDYVAAASEGTEYLVEIDQPTESTTVTVIEGSVRFDSPLGAWGSFVAQQGERVGTKRLGQVTRTTLSPEQYNLLLQELNATGLGSSLLVPEVRGLSLEAARSELTRQGLSIADVQAMPVERGRVGLVVSQSPPPGGRSQVVRLGVGGEAIPVPSLIGGSAQTAPTALEAARLKLGRITQLYSGHEKPGTITAQDPSAGTSAVSGQAVDVTVEAAPSRVPSLVGVPTKNLAALLEKSGLRLGSSSDELSETADAVVLRQDPPAERLVGPGSAVNVVVARGAVRVPNLLELRAEPALAKLVALGLSGNGPAAPPPADAALARASTGRTEPTVNAQQPEPRTMVPRGTSVELHYTVPALLCTVPDAAKSGPPVGIKQRFQQAGLVAQVVEAGSSDASSFNVQAQSAPAGAQIACGSMVTVKGAWQELIR
jgi:beta-lactam-binding protein with PASTA domain